MNGGSYICSALKTKTRDKFPTCVHIYYYTYNTYENPAYHYTLFALLLVPNEQTKIVQLCSRIYLLCMQNQDNISLQSLLRGKRVFFLWKKIHTHIHSKQQQRENISVVSDHYERIEFEKPSINISIIVIRAYICQKKYSLGAPSTLSRYYREKFSFESQNTFFLSMCIFHQGDGIHVKG